MATIFINCQDLLVLRGFPLLRRPDSPSFIIIIISGVSKVPRPLDHNLICENLPQETQE